MRLIVSLVLLVATLMDASSALGQSPSISDFAQSVEKDFYVEQMSEIMDQWDANELEFNKDNYGNDFVSALNRRIENPIHAYERATEYRAVMLEKWEALPDRVVPVLPLSSGARLLLGGIIADRTDDIREKIGLQGNMLESFGMSFFIVFGASQMEAQSTNQPRIDTTAIVSGLSEFWSVPFPFCCWRLWR